MTSYIEKLKYQMIQENYTNDYIVLVVEYAERLLENKVPVIFDFNHLCLMISHRREIIANFINNESVFYNRILIPKKDKELRVINTPTLWLKKIQEWILKDILYSIDISDHAKGFRVKHSIVDNASPHVNQKCVINIDIKDFFTSISSLQVYKKIRYLGYTTQVSSFLTSFCTLKGSLPQGAPTSPYLSNVICKRMDKRFSKLVEGLGYKYTRYADDMTFSGDEKIVNLIPLIYKIIEDEDFQVNDNKTRIQYDYQRQLVTGLVVNSQVSIPRGFIRKLRQEIYYCKKFGVSGHMRNQNITLSNFKHHLYGKAYYIKMVHKEKGKCFIAELDNIDWEY